MAKLLVKEFTDIPVNAYYIMAHRSSASVFGPATKPLREDGRFPYWEELKEVNDEMCELTIQLKTGNVWYSVERR